MPSLTSLSKHPAAPPPARVSAQQGRALEPGTRQRSLYLRAVPMCSGRRTAPRPAGARAEPPPGEVPWTPREWCPAIPGQGPLRCPGTPRAQPPGSVRPHRREPIALLSGGVDAAAAGGGSPHRALREGRAPRRRASTHAAQSSLSRPRRVAARLGPLKLQGVFFSSFDNLI